MFSKPTYCTIVTKSSNIRFLSVMSAKKSLHSYFSIETSNSSGVRPTTTRRVNQSSPRSSSYLTAPPTCRSLGKVGGGRPRPPPPLTGGGLLDSTCPRLLSIVFSSDGVPPPRLRSRIRLSVMTFLFPLQPCSFSFLSSSSQISSFFMTSLRFSVHSTPRK